jgi:hypothetical protein
MVDRERSKHPTRKAFVERPGGTPFDKVGGFSIQAATKE